MTFSVSFREPTAPKYIHIDKDNNLHLMVRTSGGVDIGTDNTCQSVVALQEFFGRHAGAEIQKKSALHELQRYKTALEFDIYQLKGNSTVKTKKQDRLLQINQLISTLNYVQSQSVINSLNALYGDFPTPIKDILGERTNCYSMLLRPNHQDGYVRCVNPVFSVNRNSNNGLFHSLYRNFQNSINVRNLTPKQKLINATKLSYNSDTIDFPRIQEHLTKNAQILLNLPDNSPNIPNFYSSNGEDLTQHYVEDVLYLDQDTVEDCIENLLSIAAQNLFDTLPQSHFQTVATQAHLNLRERLSILTQFFLGQSNMYCYAHGISSLNFGEVLDNNEALRNQVPNVVRAALENGSSVENALFDFINSNAVSFGLTRHLNSIDKQEIIQKFTAQYQTIKDSAHFDEFTVLDTSKKGKFFSHNYHICINFADLMASNAFRARDNEYFAQTRNRSRDLNPKLPRKNKSIKGSYVVDEETIGSDLVNLIKQQAKFDTLITFLTSETDNKQLVFQRLNQTVINTLRSSANWKSVRDRAAALITDPQILKAFNDRFTAQDVQLIITNAMANSIYVYAVETKGPNVTPQNPSSSDLQQLMLTIYKNKVKSVAISEGDGFVLTVSANDVSQIQTDIENFSNSMYINPTIAGYIYLEVTQHFGADSEIVKDMNCLNNQGQQPQKFLKALSLLNIQVQDINFPKGGYQGYILRAEPAMLQRIANIAQNRARFQLKQEMEAALYARARELGYGNEIQGLNNAEAPNKLARTLELLNINYNNLSFNEDNSFSLNVSSDVGRTIFEICSRFPNAREEESSSTIESSNIIIEEIPSIQIQKVDAWTGEEPLPANASLVQLNCPAKILQAFKNLLQGTEVLGSSFYNPYTGEQETFPEEADNLNARHLQILARNEVNNVDGQMNTELYKNKLTADQIAYLRCLVKASTVAGVVDVIAYGGYHSQRVTLDPYQKALIVDQAGFQFQNDFRNTGGIFFYPDNLLSPDLPANYAAWQRNLYQAMYDAQRPEEPSIQVVYTSWRGVSGAIDLNLMAKAIAVEFLQAMDAVAQQGNLALEEHERINFKFLKAGMGYFAAGVSAEARSQLEHARLLGIEHALSLIAEMPAEQRRIHIGNIKRLELPFSGSNAVESAQVISRIQTLVTGLGLQWGGTPEDDALTPREGFINATTNCADPHVMIGNEGGFRSVDAAIASNCQLAHLNSAYNTQIRLRSSPAFVPMVPLAIPIPILNPSPVSSGLMQHGIYAPPRDTVRINGNPRNEDLLKGVITQESVGCRPGQWHTLKAHPHIEAGVGGYSRNPALASPNFQIELIGNDLVILNKQNRFARVDGPLKTQIINEFLENIPQQKLLSKIKYLMSVIKPVVPNANRGSWYRLGALSSRIGLVPVPNLNDTFEVGISNSDGKWAFATADFKITPEANGQITVYDKRRNQVVPDTVDPRYMQALTCICNCFPENAGPALQQGNRGPR